ncbi:MAG TPA: SDR family NAD(P)-dependent oxidoreductase [Polyangiaceae bacterium]|jgi:3-oxoacyl-[acyl-carrier protein] reductase|nr:SDR family NAD(P)-dependent oxidoreductase [Polyangiaceae bacterium]
MDLHLKDRVALVTGGGRGVGRGVCLRLAEEGACVVVNDFHEERAVRVADEIRANGGQALAVRADITDLAQVTAMVGRAQETFGPVDILVNNAGIPARTPGEDVKGGWEDFHTSQPSSWAKVIDLNVYGTMNCTHAVLAKMVERRSGKIVSVMSEAGRVGEAKLAAYSGAKAAILGFSKAIARELGKHRINVNVVALGAVDAKEITFAEADETVKAKLGALFKSYPIGRGLERLSRANDVADAIAFLASDRAEYITGQVLGVSGGFAMP